MHDAICIVRQVLCRTIQTAAVVNAAGVADSAELLGPVQEDMYSYVTYADDQQTKGKGTAIVES